MIVSVNYLDSKTGQFRGRTYSYLCDIPTSSREIK